MYGTIERFNFKKGFGFIRGNDDDQDYFFHYTDFHGTKNQIKAGKKVQFKDKMGEKGPCALDIQLLDEKGGRKPARAAARGSTGKETGYLFTGIVIGVLIGIAISSAYRVFF